MEGCLVVRALDAPAGGIYKGGGTTRSLLPGTDGRGRDAVLGYAVDHVHRTEKQFYSRRLPIIKAIQQRHESGKASSLHEGAVQVEALRTHTHGTMSLNKLGKVLREAAAGAG
jgi:hypothetical protein